MESANKFNCAECDIIFLTKFDMAKHLGSVHAGFLLVSCKQCNPISWVKESSLQQHDINFHNARNTSDLEKIVKTRLPQGKMPQGSVPKPIPHVNKPVYSNMSKPSHVVSKQGYSHMDTSKPIPAENKPVYNADKTRHKSAPAKPPNKLALIEKLKLLRQQQDKELNIAASSKLSQYQSFLRKENSSSATKNVENSISPSDARINFAKYIKADTQNPSINNSFTNLGPQLSQSLSNMKEPRSAFNNPTLEINKSGVNAKISFMSEPVHDNGKVETLSQFNFIKGNLKYRDNHPSRDSLRDLNFIKVNGKDEDNPPKRDKLQEFNKAFGKLSHLSVSVAAVKPSPKKSSQNFENFIKKMPGISFSKNGQSFTTQDVTSKNVEMNSNKIINKVETDDNNKGRVIEINQNIKYTNSKNDNIRKKQTDTVPKKRKRNVVNSHSKKTKRSSAKYKPLLNDSGFGSELSDTSTDFTNINTPKNEVSKKIFDIFKHFTMLAPEDPEKKRQREAELKFQEELNLLWIEEVKVTDLRPPPCLRPCCTYHPPSCHCPDCLLCKGACCQNKGVRAGKCCQTSAIGKCINPGDIYCYAPCCSTMENITVDKTDTISVKLINPMNALVSDDEYVWAESIVNAVEDREEEFETKVDPFYDFKADGIFDEHGNYGNAIYDVFGEKEEISFNEDYGIPKLTSIDNDILNSSNSDTWDKEAFVYDIFRNAKSAKLMDHIENCKLCTYLFESENIDENIIEPPMKSDHFEIPDINEVKSAPNKETPAPPPPPVTPASRIRHKTSRSKSRADSHDWKEGDLSLPIGWKICTEYRPSDEKGKKAKDTYYLSPSLEFFRSRKKVMEYLKNNEAPDSDIELVKNGYKYENSFKAFSPSVNEFIKTSSTGTSVDYDMQKDIDIASEIISQSLNQQDVIMDVNNGVKEDITRSELDDNRDEFLEEDTDIDSGIDSYRDESGEDDYEDIYYEDEFVEDDAEDVGVNVTNENLDNVCNIINEQFNKEIEESESEANKRDKDDSVTISDSESSVTEDEENRAITFEQSHISDDAHEENVEPRIETKDDVVIVVDDTNDCSVDEIAEPSLGKENVFVNKSDSLHKKSANVVALGKSTKSASSNVTKYHLTKAQIHFLQQSNLLSKEFVIDKISEPIVIDDEEPQEKKSGYGGLEENVDLINFSKKADIVDIEEVIILEENVTGSLKHNSRNYSLSAKYTSKKRKDKEITDIIPSKRQKLDDTELEVKGINEKTKSHPSSHKGSKAKNLRAKKSPMKMIARENSEVSLGHPTSSFNLRKTGRTAKRKGNLQPIGVLSQFNCDEILDMIIDVGEKVKSSKAPEIYSKISNPLFST